MTIVASIFRGSGVCIDTGSRRRNSANIRRDCKDLIAR
jgi:hypothetical protein